MSHQNNLDEFLFLVEERGHEGEVGGCTDDADGVEFRAMNYIGRCGVGRSERNRSSLEDCADSSDE